jgi:hypothetical protein
MSDFQRAIKGLSELQSDYREYDRRTREKNVALDALIWCRNCKKKVKWLLQELAPSEKNPNYAQDLVCSECAWLIATFHEDRQP